MSSQAVSPELIAGASCAAATPGTAASSVAPARIPVSVRPIRRIVILRAWAAALTGIGSARTTIGHCPPVQREATAGRVGCGSVAVSGASASRGLSRRPLPSVPCEQPATASSRLPTRRAGAGAYGQPVENRLSAPVGAHRSARSLMKSVALLILRLTVGGLLAGHGAQKLFGWGGGAGLEGTTAWLESLRLRPAKAWAHAAGWSEFGGGVLTALGFLNP